MSHFITASISPSCSGRKQSKHLNISDRGLLSIQQDRGTNITPSEGSWPSSPHHGRNCRHSAHSRRVFLEPAVLTAHSSFLPKSLKPWRQHSGSGTQVPAQGQPGTHNIPSTQRLPSCTQRPKSKGHGRLLPSPALRPYLACSNSFFPCHKHLACSRLASQTHSEQRWLLRSTRGWKGSLCSVPSIPSCSVLPQSKSLFT